MFRNFRIEYNLLIVATNAGYDKFVYLKHGVASFSYNTMIGHGTYIQRHGSIQYCAAANRTNSTDTLQKCHGNWMEGTDGGRAGGFNIGGCGNDIRGNYIKAGTGIKLSNGFAQNSANEAVHQAASNSLLVGNNIDSIGLPYVIGNIESFLRYEDAQGHKIQNVKIWGHRGKAVASLASLFEDADHVVTDSCSFSTDLGPTRSRRRR